MNARSALLLFVLAVFVMGCDTNGTLPPTPAVPATAQPSDTLDLPLPAGDEEAIRWLIEAEAQGVVDMDLDLLMALWVQEARVADANHTPDDDSDDLVWTGWYAVRDRYITLVFPGGATSAKPTEMTIQIDEDRAGVISTPIINGEVSQNGDLWTLVRTEKGWRIESLTYNLEPR